MRKFCAAVVTLSLLLAAPAAAQSHAPDTERRVEAILSRMTLEEKIDLIGGVDDFFIRGVERLGVPRLKMADGPAGVRNFGPATAMPGGIALAATWNPSLVEQVGREIGRDARAKGVHFLLGPGVNIYRAPMNGRNFEYYGEDPYLAARLAVGYIRGVQSQGVAATVKHLLGNNSEFDRHRTDSVIDERTMREIYLPAFEAAVREAQVGAVMNSYNLVNGIHMSQHNYFNTDIAKREWGFDGIMMSDWNATYDGLGAANGGLDLEMPSGAHMNHETLLPAIAAGKLSVATVDDKVRRILRTAARFGWLDREQTDFSIPRYNPQGRRVALEAAREGIVLLKNEGNLLPLDRDRTKSIAIIGPSAYPAIPLGGGSGRTEPFASVSLLEGLSKQLEGMATVHWARGLRTLAEWAAATQFVTEAAGARAGVRAEYFANAELEGTAAVTRTEPHINFGRQARSFPEGTLSSRWTGYYIAQSAGRYEVFASSTGEEGGFYRLYLDDKLVLDSWDASNALAGLATLTLDAGAHKIVLEQRPNKRSGRLGTRMQLGIARHGSMVDEEAKKLAARADVVVVAVGFDPGTEGEGADRTFRLPFGQDELIREMAAANKKTIVVVNAGGGVDMSGWHESVPALVHAWYPGQEGGTALAEILCGDVNPSGRLPVTLERRLEDNPTHASYYAEAGTNRIVYKEGIFVGYRGYERAGTRPLYAFGYGLSYTSFKYGYLGINEVSERAWGGGEAGPKFEVSFDVTNTGARAGADVAQIYVGEREPSVPRPARELKGFAKISLRPGETRRVTLMLDGRAFSYYDVAAKRWRARPGEFEVSVGRSSAQIELRGKLLLPAKGIAAAARR
jgi:beta-glucosidase